MSWALPLIFLTYPWIFNTGNLPREASVTLLNTVSRGKRAIYHGKSSPCNRTYYFRWWIKISQHLHCSSLVLAYSYRSWLQSTLPSIQFRPSLSTDWTICGHWNYIFKSTNVSTITNQNIANEIWLFPRVRLTYQSQGDSLHLEHRAKTDSKSYLENPTRNPNSGVSLSHKSWTTVIRRTCLIS